FFFSSRRRHTRWPRDWSSDVCSSDLPDAPDLAEPMLRLGQLELKEKRPGEAVRALEKALALRERDHDPTEMLADIELALAQALRSEEHTSELQSRGHLVCRLLLEKKK